MYSRHKQTAIKNSVPVLYHGTDARIIATPCEGRRRHISDCKSVADYLWPFFEPFTKPGQYLKPFLPLLDDKEQQYNLRLAVSIYYNSRIRGSHMFEYDSLYADMHIDGAWMYAFRARYFGEIGLVAYYMSKIASLYRFDKFSPSDEIKEAMDRIISFAEDTPQPVVVCIRNYDATLLRTEQGDDIRMSKGQVNCSAFRYLGYIDLSTCEVLTPDEEVYKLKDRNSFLY